MIENVRLSPFRRSVGGGVVKLTPICRCVARYAHAQSTIYGVAAANPHVRSVSLPKPILAEPFQTLTFSPVDALVYQLGSFGAARKQLQALSPTP
jgi:hypothetical protein